MYCTECRAEFVAGITKCSDCGVDLVADLPAPAEVEEETAEAPVSPFVPIPVRSASDSALLQSLLRGAGFPIRVHGGETWDEILVRAEDLDAVKEFLEEYRSTWPLDDERLRISW